VTAAIPTFTPHSREFRVRRMWNWLTLGLTYAAMYMARYNFSYANPQICKEYGLDTEDMGAIISAGSLLYGLAAMFNGPIADRLGGRAAMLIGAAGACVFNLAFGLAAYMGFLGAGTMLVVYLATVWSLNQYFQSYSALSLIKVNSAWFHVAERGVFSAIFGSMIQSGRFFVITLMTSALVTGLEWQWKFFLPAFVVAVFFVITFFVVKNAPNDAGLGEFDPRDASSGDTEAITFRYVARKVFTNPVAITIAAAEFCTGLVRKGFEEWFPSYMVNVHHLTLDHPIFKKNAYIIVIAAILGAFAAGTISDWVFKHRRAPVAFIGYVIQAMSLAVVWTAPSMGMIIVAFACNSFAISMTHSMLSGTASMDFGGKRAAATAAGLFDGMQYVGGAFTGWGVGWLVKHVGWHTWAPSMVPFSIIGAILMLFLWNARPKASGGH
jgi:OPA family glycerol-3-phosphate transporter-like MFS transporter